MINQINNDMMMPGLNFGDNMAMNQMSNNNLDIYNDS